MIAPEIAVTQLPTIWFSLLINPFSSSIHVATLSSQILLMIVSPLLSDRTSSSIAIYSQTSKQAGRQTGCRTGKHTGRQTSRQAGSQTDAKIDRQQQHLGLRNGVQERDP